MSSKQLRQYYIEFYQPLGVKPLDPEAMDRLYEEWDNAIID